MPTAGGSSRERRQHRQQQQQWQHLQPLELHLRLFLSRQLRMIDL
jgi:hypothetical protein